MINRGTERQAELEQELAALRARVAELESRARQADLVERQLREREERFRTIVEAAPIGIVNLNAQGQLLRANQAFLAMSGYSEQELRERGLAGISHPDDSAETCRLFAELVDGQRTLFHQEKRYLRKDGQLLWTSLTVAAVRGPDGALLFTISMLEDIGERKRAEERQAQLLSEQVALAAAEEEIGRRLRVEEELRRSHDQLNVILSGVADQIMVQDRLGRLVYVNPAAARWLGYASAEDLHGMPLTALAGNVLLLDENRRPLAIERLPNSLLLQGQPAPPEIILCVRSLRSADERWASVKASPIYDGDQQISFVVTIWHDVTSRRRDQQRRRFLEQATVLLASSLDYELTLERVARLAVPILADFCLVLMIDEAQVPQQLALAHVDLAQEELLRARYNTSTLDRYSLDSLSTTLQSGEPLLRPRGTTQAAISGNPSAAQPDGQQQEARSKKQEARSKKQEAGSRKQPNTDASALSEAFASRFRSALCVPMRIRERVLGTITLLITESDRVYGPADLALAEELAQRAALAVDNARLYHDSQLALTAREHFLSLAAHELKTPMTAILGSAQWMQRTIERDPQRGEREQRMARSLVDQVRRLHRLSLSLLDLSRIQSGGLTIEPSILDLNALTAQLVDELRPALSSLHQLRFHHPDEPCLIAGDELRLAQVLQNLLQNALKYSPEGGTIGVTLERGEHHVIIAVSDQGLGIPEPALARIFERFYRADNVNDRQISGMGVGLAIVKEIVARHGGTIDVATREGAGSTFTVTLPIDV